jgi:ATP-binding cassette subfamily F protein uup
VIVVSHDRYFLDRTVDMVFAFEKDGEVRLYPGNYSVYLDYKKEEEETQVIAPKEQKSTKATPAETSIPNPDNRKSVKLSYKEKREYEELEMKIPEMEEEKLQIEKKLYYNPPSGHTEIQKLASRLAELTEAIDQSTERWLELAERL